MRYVIRERFFALGDDSDINDEHGNPVYQVDGKVLSLRNTLIMRDRAGSEVARIHRRLIALRPTYEIRLEGQEVAEVRKRLFSPFVDRFTIDIDGPDDLAMEGDLFDHEYTISRSSGLVATVSKRWFSLTHTYGVDIAPGENDVLILAAVLALDLAEHQEHSGDQ